MMSPNSGYYYIFILRIWKISNYNYIANTKRGVVRFCEQRTQQLNVTSSSRTQTLNTMRDLWNAQYQTHLELDERKWIYIRWIIFLECIAYLLADLRWHWRCISFLSMEINWIWLQLLGKLGCLMNFWKSTWDNISENVILHTVSHRCVSSVHLSPKAFDWISVGKNKCVMFFLKHLCSQGFLKNLTNKGFFLGICVILSKLSLSSLMHMWITHLYEYVNVARMPH